jgi:chitodextrinase
VTNFSDTTVAASSNYLYQVFARDNAGNVSAGSNEASISTSGDTEPPSIPAILAALAVSATEVDLNWTASSDNNSVNGYNLYRDNSLLVVLGAVTSYSDTNAPPSSTLTYTIRARDEAGNLSAPSTSTTANTPLDAIAPAAPTNALATAVNPSLVHITWTASTDNAGVTAYDVYRNGGFIYSVGTGTNYLDSSVTTGIPYGYTIKARDAAGNTSSPSNTANVTP